MKDAAPSTTAPASSLAAGKPAESAPTSAAAPEEPATAHASAAVPTETGGPASKGKKRKAEGDDEPVKAEEPTAKKRKGPIVRAVAKAKGVVGDMKEKASSKSKKAKKDPAPVGRTERKTRSQARAGN